MYRGRLRAGVTRIWARGSVTCATGPPGGGEGEILVQEGRKEQPEAGRKQHGAAKATTSCASRLTEARLRREKLLSGVFSDCRRGRRGSGRG